MKALKLESQRPRDKILREERIPAALMFLAGAWLIAAPFVLDYTRTLAGGRGYWIDIATGAVILVVSFFCYAVPRVASWLGFVNVILGCWLIAAPWAIGYPAEGHRDQARANDVIVGIIVAFFAVVAVTIAIRRRRAHEEG
jgi:hypothetical protein